MTADRNFRDPVNSVAAAAAVEVGCHGNGADIIHLRRIASWAQQRSVAGQLARSQARHDF